MAAAACLAVPSSIGTIFNRIRLLIGKGIKNVGLKVLNCLRITPYYVKSQLLGIRLHHYFGYLNGHLTINRLGHAMSGVLEPHIVGINTMSSGYKQYVIIVRLIVMVAAYLRSTRRTK